MRQKQCLRIKFLGNFGRKEPQPNPQGEGSPLDAAVTSNKIGKEANFVRLFFDIVFLPKPFNASRCVYKFLLAGKEGMAGRTYFNLDVLGCGTCFDHVSTGAGNFSHFVLGVNSVSHFCPPKNCPTPVLPQSPIPGGGKKV
jgi:hypothetical protein